MSNPVEGAYTILMVERYKLHKRIQAGQGAEEMWQDLQTMDQAINDLILAGKSVEIMSGFFHALLEADPKLVNNDDMSIYDQSLIARHVRALLKLLKDKHPEVYNGIIRAGTENKSGVAEAPRQPTETIRDSGIEGGRLPPTDDLSDSGRTTTN